ncbi:nucleotidyltransferase domain-containing protein [Actinoplanes sp. NPDC023714]|uniref:nucleotidyltransferase domain-containing protein n=1 Tax=Actinoplanes sp. NPDC023714 TaxID=3154322 RepID=UPI0033C3EF80
MLALASTVASTIASVLGASARSVILHGSLATGRFRPGRSDVDLLAIVDGGVTDAQAAALRELLSDPIDLHVVTSAVAGRPSRAPAVELYLGHGEFSRDVPADPDLPTELSEARARGRVLHGAPPAAVIAC